MKITTATDEGVVTAPRMGPAAQGPTERRNRIRALLARWRAAERAVAAAPAGTPGWRRARTEFEEARRQYLAEAQPDDQ
ncbi:MAG TPA: hypothetical protein VFI28_00400 [Candidatus Limnocylindrales bacterium]|nr:hypothetical protein [Candidatus Limnocylindrales bacterium]